MVSGFVRLAIYVDDINLIRTPEEFQKTIEYLKKEFEMKDLEKTKLYLGLQIEHLADGVFIYQTAYTQKVLKLFYMDKAYPLSTRMVVRLLEVSKDLFQPLKDGEEILDPEVPYLSAIGAFMYLANATRPDIAFSVNLLASCFIDVGVEQRQKVFTCTNKTLDGISMIEGWLHAARSDLCQAKAFATSLAYIKLFQDY
ncbi:uncharacterized mitochondrial protein AtMg00810-like [Capsicum annuum]|uniref:uncharacterized mitochondrial protein AtMg00810-like n=1 Tax=Capsicum annuum TaxID=4072 RepID=UPI0007BEF945|nr:uncharacterized mitochondrial protein AtMg00810-like [Capsicum annuum]